MNILKPKSSGTQKLVLLALLTAIVVVLQLIGSFFPVYPFRLNLVLVPIVVGAALIGPLAGAWLGFAFGFVVLLSSPDVAFFISVNLFATVLVIIGRGLLSGLITGVTYKLLAKRSSIVAVIAASLICPFINTSLFILGLFLFFQSVIDNVIEFFISFVLVNFAIELGINLTLSTAIIRLVQYGKVRKSG